MLRIYGKIKLIIYRTLSSPGGFLKAQNSGFQIRVVEECEEKELEIGLEKKELNLDFSSYVNN